MAVVAEPTTFIQCVQRAWKESGLSNNAPTSVESQTGMPERFVNWVLDAEREVLDSEDGLWTFNWKMTGGVLQANVDTYDPLADWGDDVRQFVEASENNHAAYIYKTSLGTVSRQWLTFMPWEHFRGINLPAQSTVTPYVWTVNPQGKVVYYPTPTTNEWTVAHECYLKPTAMSVNSSESRIPFGFRMVIVWGAVELYASFDEATVQYQRAVKNKDLVLEKMRDKHLPKWLTGGSLA